MDSLILQNNQNAILTQMQWQQLENESLFLKRQIQQLSECFLKSKIDFDHLKRRNDKLSELICGLQQVTRATCEIFDPKRVRKDPPMNEMTPAVSEEAIFVLSANKEKCETVSDLNDHFGIGKNVEVIEIHSGYQAPSTDQQIADVCNESMVSDPWTESHTINYHFDTAKNVNTATSDENSLQHYKRNHFESALANEERVVNRRDVQSFSDLDRCARMKSVPKIANFGTYSSQLALRCKRNSLQNRPFIPTKWDVNAIVTVKSAPIQVKVSGKDAYLTLQSVLNRELGRAKFSSSHVWSLRLARIQPTDDETSNKITKLLTSRGYQISKHESESKTTRSLNRGNPYQCPMGSAHRLAQRLII